MKITHFKKHIAIAKKALTR